MDQRTVSAYLGRINATEPTAPDDDLLHSLHEQHLFAVPFENLSIHLGEPISLHEPDLIDKIVKRRRGGFCYELNGAFAALLRALGFNVTLLAARVFNEGRLGAPFGHLALQTDGWLVDVGFGRHSRFPLRFDSRAEQQDPDGVFRLVDTAHGDVDVLRDGRAQYRVERRARELPDFAATCWYQQTSPASAFTRQLICSRLTHEGRISLSGNVLIRTDRAGSTRETLTDHDTLDAYSTHFGFDLDRLPRAPDTSASTDGA